MNANTEAREPTADEAGPKPEAKTPRRTRAAAAAGKAPAERTRRARKPAAKATRQAQVAPAAATSGETPAKTPAKRRAKTPAAKGRSGKRSPATAAPEAPAKPRARRRAAVDVPAQPPTDVEAAAPVETPAAATEPVAVAKARTVRETVKLTEGDLAALGHLSARADTLGHKARKSTLVRAAIRALAAMDDAALAAALDAPMPALLAVVGSRRRKAH